MRLQLGRFIMRRMGPPDLSIIHPAPSWFGPFTKAFKRLLVNEAPLESALFGPISFQVVRTSVEIGLIELLDANPGLALPAIAEKLGLTAYAVHALLIGLGALKVVIKIGDNYHADPFLSQMLLARVNDGFGPKYLAFSQHLIAPAMTQLEASVRTGKAQGLKQVFGEHASNFYQELATHDQLNAYFEPVMRHLSSVNENRVAGMRLWADSKNVLDVGGGSGRLALALARHHHQIRVTVFDFPAVAAATAAYFIDTPEAGRLHTIGGDLEREKLPDGYDCIVFSHFLDIFSKQNVLSYLQRAYAALPEGGKICIFTPVVQHDETGPVTNALLCSYFLCLANGEGRFYSIPDLIDFIRAAQFSEVAITRLPMNEVAIFAVKAGRQIERSGRGSD